MNMMNSNESVEFCCYNALIENVCIFTPRVAMVSPRGCAGLRSPPNVLEFFFALIHVTNPRNVHPRVRISCGAGSAGVLVLNGRVSHYSLCLLLDLFTCLFHFVIGCIRLPWDCLAPECMQL